MNAPPQTAQGKWFSGEFPELRERMAAHQERMRVWCKQTQESLGLSGFHLVLGGGYGRGEGGVSLENDTQHLHNDLDYFLFVDDLNAAPKLIDHIREIEHIESAELLVDVEIQPLPLSNIGEQATTLMMTDLANGHDTVYGDISAPLSVIPRDDYAHIPPEEVTRLLWNRGSGLYFSKQRLRQERGAVVSAEAMRFIVRNLQKVHLALGDAFLLRRGQYAVKVAQRAQMIAQVADKPFPSYAAAASFKERPIFPKQLPTVEEMARQIDETADLWLSGFLVHESERLGHVFISPEQYIHYTGNLYPSSSKLKNVLLRFRDQLRHRSYLPGLTDYPRAALQRALCAMLFREPDFIKTLGWSADVYSESFEEAYTAWWSRYS